MSFFQELRKHINWVSSLETTVMMLVAAATGAVTSQVYSRASSHLGIVSFLLLSMFIIWMVLAVFKGMVRMTEDA